MPYAVNRGVRLYWEEHGSGEPVLLIMGLSFTKEMWFRLLPALVPKHRVVVFDNRGMGMSDAPKGPYSIRQMALDTMAVMDAARMPRAHVLGASMGGMIAQELTIRHPERVISLMLGCTTYGGFFSRWPDLRRRPKGVKWTDEDVAARERAIIPLLYADTTPIDRIEEDLEIRARCRWSRRGFLGQFFAILLWNSYRRLHRITVPALVVHGEQDRLIPPQNGRIVARRIQGARFISLPNAGHMMITDQPEACIQAMLAFLDERSAAYKRADELNMKANKLESG